MPFTRSKRTNLRAVSLNHEEHASKAERYLRQAEEVGASTIISGNDRSLINEPLENNYTLTYPTASELQIKHELKLTIKAAHGFRIAGEHYWYDSAKAYAKAAALSAEALKDPSAAAELYTEGAIVMEHVDSDFANEYYRKAISHHCDASQYKAAAILEERLANNHSKKENFNSSIDDLIRATKLYTAANDIDNADRTLDRTAYLLGKVGRVRDSAYSYRILAGGQATQNLKMFNCPSTMLRAGILLLSDCLKTSPELDFSELRQMMEEAHELDCRFDDSREHAFLVDMMKCVVHGDLDKFADCLFSFNLLAKFDDLILDALEVIKTVVKERAEVDRSTR